MSVRMLRTAYTVREMDHSLRFYKDLLNLRVVRDKIRTGPSYDTLVGIRDVRLRVVLLEDGSSGNLLELVEFLEPRAAEHVPREHEIGGSTVCFVVDDLEALHRRLRAAGIEARSEPADFVQEGQTVGRIVTVFDPDHIPVVLFEKRP